MTLYAFVLTVSVGLPTRNPAGYPKCNIKSGEHDAHSSAAMKSGVFCHLILSYQ